MQHILLKPSEYCYKHSKYIKELHDEYFSSLSFKVDFQFQRIQENVQMIENLKIKSQNLQLNQHRNFKMELSIFILNTIIKKRQIMKTILTWLILKLHDISLMLKGHQGELVIIPETGDRLMTS